MNCFTHAPTVVNSLRDTNKNNTTLFFGTNQFDLLVTVNQHQYLACF